MRLRKACQKLLVLLSEESLNIDKVYVKQQGENKMVL